MALKEPKWSHRVYVTEVTGDLKVDTFFPKLSNTEWDKVDEIGLL